MNLFIYNKRIYVGLLGAGLIFPLWAAEPSRLQTDSSQEVPAKPQIIEPLDNSADRALVEEIQDPPAGPKPVKTAAPKSEPVVIKEPAVVAKSSEPAPTPTGHPASQSLTAQASDPTAPLIQAQLTYLYSDHVKHSNDDARQLLFEPVIPLPPNRLVPLAQIIRPTFAYLNAPDGSRGFGDIDIQHIFIPKKYAWGTLGYGYTATLPTASQSDLGGDKYQLGPASTIIYYGFENWQIGGTVAQSWSIAGESNAANISQFTFQPIVNYMAGPWYIGIGDFTWSYDFKADRGWTIPLGF